MLLVQIGDFNSSHNSMFSIRHARIPDRAASYKHDKEVTGSAIGTTIRLSKAMGQRQHGNQTDFNAATRFAEKLAQPRQGQKNHPAYLMGNANTAARFIGDQWRKRILVMAITHSRDGYHKADAASALVFQEIELNRGSPWRCTRSVTS